MIVLGARTAGLALRSEEHGEAVRAALSQYMPDPLLVQLGEHPESFARLYYKDRSTPELVWDRALRNGVKADILTELAEYDATLRAGDPGADGPRWEPRGVGALTPPGVLVVDSVFVANYVASPDWRLEAPVRFALALLAELEVPLPSSAEGVADNALIFKALQTCLGVYMTW